jgi:hypothetical protein
MKPANLSNELQRRRPNLVVSNRRIEIEKNFDIPAHRL